MLREITEDDLPIFFEHQRDPAAYLIADFPPRAWEPFLIHWRTKVLSNDTGEKRTIVADGQVAGNVVSWEQDGRRLVGYWIGREYWGRGTATAALAEFLLIERTRPLHAFVAPQNKGSIRVLEKCGFHRTSEDDLYVLEA